MVKKLKEIPIVGNKLKVVWQTRRWTKKAYIIAKKYNGKWIPLYGEVWESNADLKAYLTKKGYRRIGANSVHMRHIITKNIIEIVTISLHASREYMALPATRRRSRNEKDNISPVADKESDKGI